MQVVLNTLYNCLVHINHIYSLMLAFVSLSHSRVIINWLEAKSSTTVGVMQVLIDGVISWQSSQICTGQLAEGKVTSTHRSRLPYVQLMLPLQTLHSNWSQISVLNQMSSFLFVIIISVLAGDDYFADNPLVIFMHVPYNAIVIGYVQEHYGILTACKLSKCYNHNEEEKHTPNVNKL